jgi:hypothetical protein
MPNPAAARDDASKVGIRNGDTRIEAGGKPRPATELRKGDAVTVSYMDRDGKIVAQNVKVNAR